MEFLAPAGRDLAPRPQAPAASAGTARPDTSVVLQARGRRPLGEGRPAVAEGERGRPQGQARLRHSPSSPSPVTR